jgi:hypothetical protein
MTRARPSFETSTAAATAFGMISQLQEPAKQGDPADVASQVVVLSSLNVLHKVQSAQTVATLIYWDCQIRMQEPLGRLIAW